MLKVPRLVIAGASSGAGKTTLTVGLCRALCARGLKVATFKAGPDYLDPTYHARASGSPSHTLDGWMMGREAVLDTFASVARYADLALIEGVMGLFDGASPQGEEGSTAEIAKWLRAPVLVAVDASGMSRTLAAIVHGMATFDPALQVAGAIANFAGSRGHLAILRESMRDIPLLGGLPKEPSLSFPERHLGLKTADEQSVPDALLDAWGKLVEEWCDVSSLIAVARAAPPMEPASLLEPSNGATRCRIGIARDAAFHFYYEDNLRRLENSGAELIEFSPLCDSRLPAVDGLYLGGGYPEVHAAALAANAAMISAIRAFAAEGRPIYAECGGLMYLSRAIRTADGQAHEMASLIPAQAVVHNRLQALGYAEVETLAPTILGPSGLRFRGHQFRYSELRFDGAEIDRKYRVRGGGGGDVLEGYSRANVLASYVHAHWASNPDAAAGLVQSCANAQPKRSGSR